MIRAIRIGILWLYGAENEKYIDGGAVDAEKSQCGCAELADLGGMMVQNEKYNSGELR